MDVPSDQRIGQHLQHPCMLVSRRESRFYQGLLLQTATDQSCPFLCHNAANRDRVYPQDVLDSSTSHPPDDAISIIYSPSTVVHSSMEARHRRGYNSPAPLQPSFADDNRVSYYGNSDSHPIEHHYRVSHIPEWLSRRLMFSSYLIVRTEVCIFSCTTCCPCAGPSMLTWARLFPGWRQYVFVLASNIVLYQCSMPTATYLHTQRTQQSGRGRHVQDGRSRELFEPWSHAAISGPQHGRRRPRSRCANCWTFGYLSPGVGPTTRWHEPANTNRNPSSSSPSSSSISYTFDKY